MWHLCKYHFLSLIRNKNLLFWSLLFPILISTFMQMSVQNAYEAPAMEPIKLGVVGEEISQDAILLQILESAAVDGTALFDVIPYEEKEAEKALQADEIIAYLTTSGTCSVHVNTTGNKQSIVVAFLDEYLQNKAMMEKLIAHGVSPQEVANQMKASNTYIQNQQKDSNVTSTAFYAVLAMTSLYGGYWILRSSHAQMPNQSECGKRNIIAPTPRLQQLLADFLVTIALNFVVQLIMVAYMIQVLHIAFGATLWPVLLVLATGTLAGNALGLLISMYGKNNFKANTSILTIVTLIACMLSGMMVIQMKYYVQHYAPLLAYLNPANMITDALYANYYYGVGERFYFNIASLLLFTIIAYAIGYARLRRKQYDSL